MKRKKIIVLTSILTFSLNVFAPNIFAQEFIKNPNIVNNKNSINTTNSENKTDKEHIENKEPKNEINDNNNDKVFNNLNKVKKDTTEDKKTINNTIPYDKETNNKIQNTTNINNTETKVESKKIDTTNKNNSSVNKNENNKAVTDEIINIPDANFKAGLNEAIASQTSTVRTATQDITLSELQSLKKLDLRSRNISNITGLEHCTNITYLNLEKNKITNLDPLRNLTKLTFLILNNNKITNIEPLSRLTELDYLYLQGNNISDLTPFQGFTSIHELQLYGNKISDISPLKNIKRISGSITLGGQRIDAPQVDSIGPNATVDNLIKGINGDYVNINNTNEYTYDSITHKVTFTQINQTGSQSYTFQNSTLVGGRNANFAGTVTQNIVYNELADIPDNNLKTALNQKIAKQTNTPRTDDQDITISELKSLKDDLNLSNKNISNITGLEYCTNITSLELEWNNISNISPLENLINLKSLSLGDDIVTYKGNNISDISALSGLVNLTKLKLSCNKISNIDALTNLKNLTYLELSKNKITDISALQHLINLTELHLNNNKISNISALSNLKNLTNLNLNNNNIVDLSPINNFKSSNLNISIEKQSITLDKTTVDDGSLEIPNPVTFPRFYKETPNISISPNGNIGYVKEGNKLNLSSLSNSISKFTINESAKLSNTTINGNYSVNITLPVEHVSTIKVDLPTSMTFDIVTNTIDPETNRLKPTFATADYTIKNRGKKPVKITPSYSATSQGGVDLVENITNRDISKDNNVKIAVKLKNISTNKDIMSIVDKEIGTEFSVESESNVQLRFEPGTNGMADAEREQLSNTKTTSGKILLTISN